jgi:hypothetical protein
MGVSSPSVTRRGSIPPHAVRLLSLLRLALYLGLFQLLIRQDPAIAIGAAARLEPQALHVRRRVLRPIREELVRVIVPGFLDGLLALRDVLGQVYR